MRLVERISGLLRMLVVAAGVLLLGFFAGTGVAALAAREGIGSVATQDAAPSAAAVQGEPTVDAEGDVSRPVQADTWDPPAVQASAWDEERSPNYYEVLGQAVVRAQIEAGTVCYAPLDALGRAGGAAAMVTYDLMEAGRARSRADLSEVSPSGWGHNAEVDIAQPDGRIYHGQLYNRSHLVAKSLGGDDELHNLICATRMQNVGANVDGIEGGMAYAEGLVRSWLERHPEATVYYAATPAYVGDELVPRSVIVDVRTSDGSIDQRIEVHNAALGFEIDYASGQFEVAEDAEVASARVRAMSGQPSGSDAAEPTSGVVVQGSPEAQEGERMVIVTGSGKAYHHDESCPGLANARSMEWVSVSEAQGMGRHPCGICGG